MTSKQNLVRKMDAYIKNEITDEDDLYSWITYGVPDCPSESDYDFIADDDEEYSSLCRLFVSLIFKGDS